TVVIGRQNAIVEGDDVVLGTQAAHADLLSLTARGTADGNTGEMLQRVGDVGFREATQLLGVDGVLHNGGVLLVLEGFLEAAPHAGDHHLFELRLVAFSGRRRRRPRRVGRRRGGRGGRRVPRGG